MKLTIPTWLVFFFLGIASFAPMVNVQRRSWVPYYGALLMCWVLVSVAVMRRMAREDQKVERSHSRLRRPLFAT
jgi:type IV secretory pathway TrbD component